MDLSFLERADQGATPLDQYLNTQRWYYDWAREDVSYSLIDDTFDWLEDHRPIEEPAGAQLG